MSMALHQVVMLSVEYDADADGEGVRADLIIAARIVGELHEPSVVPMTDVRQGAGFSISSMVDAPASDGATRAHVLTRCAHGRLLTEDCPECAGGVGTPTEFRVTDEERAALDRALEDRQRELRTKLELD